MTKHEHTDGANADRMQKGLWVTIGAILLVNVIVGLVVYLRTVTSHNGDSSRGSAHNTMAITDDRSFINAMIPHHEEAIEESLALLERTEDAKMRDFLTGVVTAQTEEVDRLRAWHTDWYGSEPVTEGYTDMMGDIAKIPDTDRARAAYIDGMIAHHKGAVEMAMRIRTITKREEIRSLADDIIRTQTGEISTLERWRKDSGATGMSPDHVTH